MSYSVQLFSKKYLYKVLHRISIYIDRFYFHRLFRDSFSHSGACLFKYPFLT